MLIRQLFVNKSSDGSLKKSRTREENGAVMRTLAYIQLCVRLRVGHAGRCQFPLPSAESEPAPLGLRVLCLHK